MGFQSFIKSEKGMSLVEIMTVLTVMSLVGLGSATMMKNMFEVQRRSESKTGLLSFRDTLINTLKNDTHWNAIVNNGSNAGITKLTCQQTATPNCTSGGAPGLNFDVYTEVGGAATLLYNGVNAGAGLTVQGGTCNTFPSLACPFRYNLTVQTECFNGEPNCPKPQVVITGDFTKAAISDPILDKIDDRSFANNGTFSFELRRGERSRYEPFELVEYSPTSGAALTPPGAGGGACNPGAWANRPLSTEISDVGDNVTVAGGGVMAVEAGTYECTVTAQGYDQITGFTIELRDLTGGTAQTVGSSVTGDNASATVIGKVEMRLNVPSNLVVRHYCQTPSDDLIVPNSDMGRPIPDYTEQSVFTRVYCVRTL